MTNASLAPLTDRTVGPVWTRNGADPNGYDRERSGFNLALDHRPGVLLAAETPRDVAAGVRYSVDNDLAIDIQATGHGAFRSMDGGLLISTRRLTGVIVDEDRRTARVGAGATVADVITAIARYGLAAAVGAAPGVGFLSYSLGGGLGSLGRRYGWSAEHIRSLNVVTADGRELVVTSDNHPDLFWGLRGGGGNLGAVTEIDVDLFPVPGFYGGGLFIDGEHAGDVLDRFRQCTVDAPDELSLSVAFVAFPDLAVLPPPIRGRFCAHVRVVCLGQGDDVIAEAERLIAPLRGLPVLLDSIRPCAFAEIGSVHADPVLALPVHSDSAALPTGEPLDALADRIDPEAPFMLEVRHLGGELAQDPAQPDAVGRRDTLYNVFTSAYPGVDPVAAASAQRRLYDGFGAVDGGGVLRTFLPSQHRDATACYEPDTARRLAALKATWDPADLFRYAPAIAPEVVLAPAIARAIG